MNADGDNLAKARHTGRLAPLPDHRHVGAPWWQELWSRHSHITTPLRQRGLECDIEYGLSAYIVRVSLPDDSHLIIGPPQEPSSDRPPGDPEGWIVTREHPDDQALIKVLYDSGTPDRPEAVHGGSVPPLIHAIDLRLAQLGLLNAPDTRAAMPPRVLRGYARRDAAAFLAEHPLPQEPLPLPVLTPFLSALGAAETPAEVSAITHHLAGITAPVLDHIARHIVGVALWRGQDHRHTPQAQRLLREAAQSIRTAMEKVAEADLENLRAEYAPAPAPPSAARKPTPPLPPAPPSSPRPGTSPSR
ncbi:hypothetical protein ACN6LM_003789 [Streptomyces sp. SAS_281]|uniref:hypothetical protein n=1 Tax=Streptomyces sp. SAS_281 TaxID=3412744 RepID=UPI00403C6531